MPIEEDGQSCSLAAIARSPRNDDRRNGRRVAGVSYSCCLRIFEFGHAQLINNVLNSACRNAARIGAVEGSTHGSSANACRANDRHGCAHADSVEIFVKNASSFDGGGSTADGRGLEELPDIELADTEPRTLFVVRAKVPYNERRDCAHAVPGRCRSSMPKRLCATNKPPLAPARLLP